MTHMPPPPDFGRGKSKVLFFGNTVQKLVTDQWEPMYMGSLPDIFVSVVGRDEKSFTMLRGIPGEPRNRREALLDAAPRLRYLWHRPWDTQDVDWRLRLRAHLFTVISRYHLDISMVTTDHLVRMIPDVVNPRLIHGDPTLANCVWDPRKLGWFWIDPLTRSYIPGDPHVDFGKLLQSCFGYEDILLGYANPAWDTGLMRDLATKLDLNLSRGVLWYLVHLIRLLPYQDLGVRPHFERQFKLLWSWVGPAK